MFIQKIVVLYGQRFSDQTARLMTSLHQHRQCNKEGSPDGQCAVFLHNTNTPFDVQSTRAFWALKQRTQLACNQFNYSVSEFKV
jgi:hypothetical protein